MFRYSFCNFYKVSMILLNILLTAQRPLIIGFWRGPGLDKGVPRAGGDGSVGVPDGDGIVHVHNAIDGLGAALLI